MMRGDEVTLRGISYSRWFARTYPSLINYLEAMPLGSMWVVQEVYPEDATLASGPVVLLHVPREFIQTQD